MKDRPFEFKDPRGGSAIGIRVVTRSTVTEIAGKTEDGTLKVRLIASPAGDPAANQELVAFLAEKLGVNTDKIEIVAGAENRDKILSIEGMTTEEVEERLIGLSD